MSIRAGARFLSTMERSSPWTSPAPICASRELAMAIREVVIDACCTLDLLATRREVEIVRAIELHLLDSPQVSVEPLFLWTPPNDEGERTREPTSTAAFREGGHLTTRLLDTAALGDAFVAAAARIKETAPSGIPLAGALARPHCYAG